MLRQEDCEFEDRLGYLTCVCDTMSEKNLREPSSNSAVTFRCQCTSKIKTKTKPERKNEEEMGQT
jgi:hypothetical protein